MANKVTATRSPKEKGTSSVGMLNSTVDAIMSLGSGPSVALSTSASDFGLPRTTATSRLNSTAGSSGQPTTLFGADISVGTTRRDTNHPRGIQMPGTWHSFHTAATLTPRASVIDSSLTPQPIDLPSYISTSYTSGTPPSAISSPSSPFASFHQISPTWHTGMPSDLSIPPTEQPSFTTTSFTPDPAPYQPPPSTTGYYTGTPPPVATPHINSHQWQAPVQQATGPWHSGVPSYTPPPEVRHVHLDVADSPSQAAISTTGYTPGTPPSFAAPSGTPLDTALPETGSAYPGAAGSLPQAMAQVSYSLTNRNDSKTPTPPTLSPSNHLPPVAHSSLKWQTGTPPDSPIPLTELSSVIATSFMPPDLDPYLLPPSTPGYATGTPPSLTTPSIHPPEWRTPIRPASGPWQSGTLSDALLPEVADVCPSPSPWENPFDPLIDGNSPTLSNIPTAQSIVPIGTSIDGDFEMSPEITTSSPTPTIPLSSSSNNHGPATTSGHPTSPFQSLAWNTGLPSCEPMPWTDQSQPDSTTTPRSISLPQPLSISGYHTGVPGSTLLNDSHCPMDGVSSTLVPTSPMHRAVRTPLNSSRDRSSSNCNPTMNLQQREGIRFPLPHVLINEDTEMGDGTNMDAGTQRYSAADPSLQDNLQRLSAYAISANQSLAGILQAERENQHLLKAAKSTGRLDTHQSAYHRDHRIIPDLAYMPRRPKCKIPKPTDMVAHRSSAANKKSEVIRRTFDILLKRNHQDDAIPGGPPENIAFPTEEVFYIEWTEDCRSRWNHAAIGIILEYINKHFISEVPEEQRMKLRSGVKQHLRYLRSKFNGRLTEEQRAEEAVAQAAKARKRYMFYRRMLVLQIYGAQYDLDDLQLLYLHLGPAGMSSDEEDPQLSHQNGFQTFIVRQRPEFSDDLARLGQQLDNIYDQYVKPKYPNGTIVHHRVRQGVYSDIVHRTLFNLPTNAYHQDYINSLDPFDRTHLELRPSIAFEAVNSILSKK